MSTSAVVSCVDICAHFSGRISRSGNAGSYGRRAFSFPSSCQQAPSVAVHCGIPASGAGALLCSVCVCVQISVIEV